jgi:membrane-associated phospholipid phosphatase
VTVSRHGSSPVAAPASGTFSSTARASADLGFLTAVSAAIALAMTYVLAVRTEAGQLIDTHAMTILGRYVTGADWTATLLSAISPATVLLATASLALFLWAARGAAAAAAATTTAAGTIVGAIALKVALVRPMLIDQSANSFPSGHVAAVAGLAAAATFAAKSRWRLPIALAGLAGVLMTGLATVALQWHRPSDVLGAALLAITVATATDSLFATRVWRVAQAGALDVTGEAFTTSRRRK